MGIGMVKAFFVPPLGEGKVIVPLVKSMHLSGICVSRRRQPVAKAISKTIPIQLGLSGRAARILAISSSVMAGFSLAGSLERRIPSIGLNCTSLLRTACRMTRFSSRTS